MGKAKYIGAGAVLCFITPFIQHTTAFMIVGIIGLGLIMKGLFFLN
jgi:hypothetical protein